ncbi:hypothetical protein HU200_066885 [Digitaria exilis]|uniref:SB domain-containing protein n=1 Tax=Digitaria exilis TaxID=1010633 RepID=A0A834ZXE7_9POAL|nr:hypothetical protein HU200_066885 [Digitaria exilis]
MSSRRSTSSWRKYGVASSCTSSPSPSQYCGTRRDPLTTTMTVEEERRWMRVVLVDELAARQGRDAAAFRGGVDEDIHAMASLQAVFRERGHAMGAAARELEEERMRLERAVTASLAHCGKLLAWLHEARCAPPDDAGAALAPHAAAEQGGGARHAIDALGHAMENGELGFQEYIRRVKILAREQFFHCYAASKSMGT